MLDKLITLLEITAPHEHLVEQSQALFDTIMQEIGICYQVLLGTYVPANKIKIIKALRDHMDIGLREAKELVESCEHEDQVVLTTANKRKAESLFRELNNYGYSYITQNKD